MEKKILIEKKRIRKGYRIYNVVSKSSYNGFYMKMNNKIIGTFEFNENLNCYLFKPRSIINKPQMGINALQEIIESLKKVEKENPEKRWKP